MSHPRFFCDNCGTEVKRNADRCPKCGRHFSTVLCPKCGFSGLPALFSAGCPRCGYSAPPAQLKPASYSGGREKRLPAGALPVWVYILAVSGLLLVLAIAYLVLF